MKRFILLLLVVVSVVGMTSCKKENVLPVDEYKSYVGLVSQSGTSAPTVNILKNTIGNIEWSYSTTGEYIGTLNGAFPSGKTFLYIEDGTINGGGGYFISIKRVDENKIAIFSSYSDFTGANNAITNRSIEIRVYN